MGAEQNTGGTCRRANSWRQNEKHDRGDRMCNREAATEAVPADRVHLLIENFFFQLSSGARFSLAAQGLFLEQSNWLRYVTHDESRNRNSWSLLLVQQLQLIKMQPPRAGLISIIYQDLSPLLWPHVTLCTRRAPTYQEWLKTHCYRCISSMTCTSTDCEN